MKLRSRWLDKLAGLLGSAAIRAWMNSLDCKIFYYDRAIDPAFPECHGQKIYIFWHEYLLFPFYLRGHCNIAMLLSRHHDAEILSHAAYHMGFDCVRGSTNRGGVVALRQLLRKSRHMHLTITPDGPRGPRRKMAAGPIYLASRLGIPLVGLGFGYDRCWRVQKAWDRFAIPKPYCRARAIYSGEIHVPPDLDREGIEHYRQQVERLLNRLTLEAETWAAAGTRKVNQMSLHRAGAPLRSARPRSVPSHGSRPTLSEEQSPSWSQPTRTRRVG